MASGRNKKPHSVGVGWIKCILLLLSGLALGADRADAALADPTAQAPYPIDSKDELRCVDLATRQMGTMKSLTKIRAAIEVARLSAPLLGDFVEAGVAEGGGSMAVLFYLACSGRLPQGRLYHLFDTWEGIPAPKVENEFDEGFKKGLWNVGMKRFWKNVEKWGAFYHEHPHQFYTWTEVRERMQVHVGLFADTMPSALLNRRVAGLYCDGDMYESSLDCLASASSHLQDRAWIYHDDYYTFIGNYMAVSDWIDQKTHEHSHIQLVPQPPREWHTSLEEEASCQPPLTNAPRQAGHCGKVKFEACFWQVRALTGV